MRKKRIWAGLLLLATLIVIGFGASMVHRARAAKRYINSTTPTFFIHGWGVLPR